MKRKIKAFTIAEILIVTGVIGIVALATMSNVHSMIQNYSNKYMYYTAFTSLQNAVYQMTSSSYTFPTTGATFCPNFSSFLNTIGTIACGTNVTTNFAANNANFTTSNGMRFYNFGSAPTSTLQSGYYTVYIDIDGPSRKGTLNDDVMAFNVYLDGTVLPDDNSTALTNKNYMTATVAYLNSSTNTNTIVAAGLTYKDATCAAKGFYKGVACSSPSPTQNAACTAQLNAGTICQVVVDKPNFSILRLN